MVPCMQAKPKFAQLLIPTVDSVRYEYLLSLVLSVKKVHTSHLIGQWIMRAYNACLCACAGVCQVPRHVSIRHSA